MHNRNKRRDNIKRNRHKTKNRNKHTNNNNNNKNHGDSINITVKKNNNNNNKNKNKSGNNTVHKQSTTTTTTIPNIASRRKLLKMVKTQIDNDKKRQPETVKITHEAYSIGLYNIDKYLTKKITLFENEYK